VDVAGMVKIKDQVVVKYKNGSCLTGCNMLPIG
jgi:hypothetical protein